MAAGRLGFEYDCACYLHDAALHAAGQRRQFFRRQHRLEQAKAIAQDKKVDRANLAQAMHPSAQAHALTYGAAGFIRAHTRRRGYHGFR